MNELEDAIANVSLGQGPGNFPQVGFVAARGAVRVRGIEATAGLRYGGR